MALWIALLLGFVEGLTEFLPVSSTGHLLLVDALLGRHDKEFVVAIQGGAVLAVVFYYRSILWTHIMGFASGKPASRKLALALLLGFLPVAVVGLLFNRAVEAHLFGPLPVAAALLVGGIAMVLVERMLAGRENHKSTLEDVTPLDGLRIGLWQCLSLWPGTSRSMSTILGGRIGGLSPATAAEFSFLLSIPTIGAATVFSLVKKEGRALLANGELRFALVLGFLCSFLVAWAVIAAFLRFLRSNTLAPFGYYRIGLGLLLLAYLFVPR